MLIAYPGDNQCHLLFLEAKGDSAFSNRQLCSKAKRLEGIFGENGCKWEGVKPHFALISRKKPDPEKLDCIGWPKWMLKGEKPAWVKLDWPCNLMKISRSNEDGKRSAKGGFWKVLQDSKTLAEIEDET